MTTIYKWVATILLGEPAPFYAERALKVGWIKCESWNTVPLLEPFHRDGFDLYYRDDRGRDSPSEPHKQAVKELLAAENHYLAEPTGFRETRGNMPSKSGRSPLWDKLTEYYRPENRALYPERQAEFEASEAALQAKGLSFK